MSDIVKFSMTLDQVKFFVEKIHDLVSIDNEVLLKVDKENILLYSIVGEKMSVNAFKSFIYKTIEMFNFEVEPENEIRFIITNGKKLESSLKNFYDFDEGLKCEFYMNDDTYADNFRFKNSKLKLGFTGGDIRAVNTSIDIDKINKTINKDNIDFRFSLDASSFAKIKKMMAIDLDNDILTLSINNKKLDIGENNWNLNICDIEHDDLSITFPKKYFKSITFTEDNIDVFVFDTFILIDNQNTNLLIALELTV